MQTTAGHAEPEEAVTGRGPRRLRRRVSVVVVSLAVALGAACLPPPSEPRGEGPLVAIVGDSLMHLAEHGEDDPDGTLGVTLLSDEVIERGHSVTTSMMPGARIESLDTVTWPADPDILVIGLGTNDLIDNQHATSARDALAHLDDHAARWPDACLVLVTVAETSPRGLFKRAHAFNAGLIRRADVLVDWAERVADEPELLTPEGIHHTDGGEAYREAILDGIDQC